MSVKYKIRQGRREDAPGMFKLVLEEGWNQVIDYLQIPFDCFPEGVFVAESSDEEIISQCASAPLDDLNGFMAYYITKKSLRRQGIGRQVFDLSYKALGNRNIGLDAVWDQKGMYASGNFNIETFTLEMYEFPIKNLLKPKGKKSSCKIVDITDVDVQQVLAYDKKIHPMPRQKVLKWTLEFATAGRVALDGDEIKGWGILCKGSRLYRLMPLYSNTPDVAEDLAGDLLKQVPGEQEAEIEIGFPEDNMAARKLFGDLGVFNGEYRCSKQKRMFTDHDIPVPTHLVYPYFLSCLKYQVINYKIL